MMMKIEDFQKLAKDQMDTASATMSALTKNAQAIAAEATDYSKKSVEAGSSHFEKLMGVKSLESAIQLQSDYAKTAYEGFVAQATKMGELFTQFAKDAFKPVETAVAKVQAAK